MVVVLFSVKRVCIRRITAQGQQQGQHALLEHNALETVPPGHPKYHTISIIKTIFFIKCVANDKKIYLMTKNLKITKSI